MNEVLPLTDPPPNKPPRLDHGATRRYWLLMMPIIVGPSLLLPWPYKAVGALSVWFFAIIWMVMRTLRRQLGPALLQGKGRNNRWIVGLDLWSIDMSIMISLIIMITLIAKGFQIEMAYLVMLPLFIRNILVPRVVIPLLSRWGVPHKPTPSFSDWDREFIA